MKEQNAEFLRRLLNQVPSVVYAWRSRPGQPPEIAYMNGRAPDLFELSLEEMEADPARLLRWHPDDREAFQLAGAAASSGGRALSWTGRMLFDEARIKVVRCVAEPLKEPDGATLWVGTFTDVTAEREAEDALHQAQLQRQEEAVLFRAVVDHMPVGVTVMNPAGEFIVFNEAARLGAGETVEYAGDTDISSTFGVFRADGETPFPEQDLPIVRALRGETSECEMLIRNASLPRGVLLAVEARPIPLSNGTTLALALSRDITEQRALEEEVRRRNRQLAESEEEKSQLVARLRYAIDELSNPILEVWDDVLAMPLIGVVDSRRTADMAQRLLAEVARTQAQSVIIDLTGVEVVDTKTADNLIKLVRKVELIGARCVLTGIRPSVAETVVEIGVEFAGLVTLRNLKHGLQEVLRHHQRQRFLGQPGADPDEDRPRRRRRPGD